MKFKKLTAILLAMLMIFSFAACGSQKQEQAQDETEISQTLIDKIKEKGTLVVGTSADYPPYEFHTEINGEDKIVGFEMAIAQKLADEMGVELELVDMSFDGLLISLQKGDFDMVIAGLSATDERKKSVDFSRGVLTDGQQVILIKKTDDEKFNTTEDLATYACGCQNGTIQQGFAEKYSGADNFIALSKFNDLVMELQSGKLDAVYVDYLVGLSYCTGNPDLMIKDVGIEYESKGVAVAFKKGNEEAVEYVNAILDEIVESGEFDQYVQDAVELAAADLME